MAKYIYYDTSNHEDDEMHCDAIARRVTSELGDVDGCLTLWDDCIPLAALLCARLGKAGIPYSGARAAKQKSLALDALRGAVKAGLPVRQYASRCCSVSSLQEVEESSKVVGFPAVMKPEYGGGAVGVKLVNNLMESQEHFKRIQSMHGANMFERKHVLGKGFGSDCALMEFLEGSEHCVDLATFHGELLCAFVTDKGPQSLPDTFHTVTIMPSLLTREKQTEVVKAALECCRALGLDHGLFDVDVMLTERGPKLIEINARMGGYCQRDLVLHCYDVDLLHLAYMLACDVKPHFSVDPFSSKHDVTSIPRPRTILDASAPGATPSGTPTDSNGVKDGFDSSLAETTGRRLPRYALPQASCFVVGLSVYPGKHGTALKTTARPQTLQRLHDDGELLFFRHEAALREQLDQFPFCTLSVQGPTFSAARSKLQGLCLDLGIEAPELSSRHYPDTHCF